ncbi:Oidioi.mRNA.OKI2018_I69.chr2.g6305.t1.cds [Oikopleura dioica]|uniref:Oidioi.mRNA.OKI2018_I69.chr2.g6305.t1.cds n=1 Tax=Oikopleura dioica TaxID=34765 RepID=A0ABN7T689_OIKDI|nr:Oidioi.mRNA.OKI2018_I69.chr2.g6305.t1.cds [Oikopleura dioica]
MLIEFFLLWSSVKSAKRKLSADSFTSPVVLLETVDQGQIEYKHFYSINYQEDAESARRNCRAGSFSKRKKPQRGARTRRAIKPQKNDVSVTTQGLHFYHKIDLKELTCTCNEEISKLERKIDRLTKLVRRLKDKPKNNKLQSSKEPLQIPEIAPVTEKPPVVTTTEEVKIVKCPNDCSGNGKCDEKTGLCSCDESWLGKDCADKICPKNCNNQGECVDGACKCHQKSDGRFWTGPACETLACFDDCNGRGSCLNGVCDCDLPWFGKDCSERKCLKPCQNGFCVDGTCKCAKGFTGIDCSEKTCPNNCSKHGTCKNGVCQCRNIWKGKDCSIRTCAIGSLAKGEPAKLCFGHGECDEKTGTCNCWNQFTGFNCARKKCIPTCTGNRICNGRTGRCLCRRNWHGEDCNVPRCPNNCNNGNGRCNPKTGTCTCKPNWTGDDCSIPACNKECQHECKCDAGYCLSIGPIFIIDYYYR